MHTAQMHHKRLITSSLSPPHTRIRRNRQGRVGVYLRVFFINYRAKVLIYFEKYVQKLTKGADKPTKQHHRLRQQPLMVR